MSSSFYSGSGLTATEQDSIESAITAAQTAQSGAETAKTASETAKTGAETAETNAETAQAAAEAAKVSAEAARDTANSSSSSASTSAATSTTQAQAASASASSASASAATATTQAATATTQAQAASASASSASTSAATATTQANNSSTSAAAALASKNAAAASESQVSTDASTATTQAGNSATSATASSNSAAAALVSQNAAAASASSASTDAATATTKAGESSTSAAASLASQNASASSASAASTSATSAASSLSSFQNQYLGASGSAPTQDPDGSALDLGDLYFDTTANVMKVYSGSGWTNASSSVNGTSERQTYTATAGQDTFNVTYDAGFVDVWLNGAKLLAGTDFTATSGTNIVLASAAAAGDIVDILAFGTFVFTSNDHYTKSASDTRYVQVAGDTMTGDLTVNGNLNVAGTTVTIDSANAQTVDLGDNDKIRMGDGDDLQLYHDGSNSYISESGTGDLNITSNSNLSFDVAGYVILDTDNGNIYLNDDGTGFGQISGASQNLTFKSSASDKDIIFQGNDGGSSITALTLDMSDAGTAIFNNNVGIGTSSITSGFKLDVIGDARFSDAAGDDAVELGWSGGGSVGFVQAYDRGASAFRDLSLNNAVTITSSGNVGIGVTPTYKLDISGEALRIKNTSGTGYIIDQNSNSSVSHILYENSFMRFGTNSAERMRIGSSGEMQLGGTTNAGFIDFDGSSLQLNTQRNPNTGAFVNTGRAHTSFQMFDGNGTPANSYIRFGTASANNTTSTERMRIDSSGNVLVGKTTTAFGTEGVALRENRLQATNTGNAALELNRLSDDGEIIGLYKDSSSVGSIFSSGGVQMGIGTGDTAILFAANANAWLPWNTDNTQRDNAIDLGRSATRFDDIYATNGTIQTSDSNEKQDIEALSEAEQRVAVAAKGLLRKFRWKSAVEEKGEEARIHFGIIAQDLKSAFEAEGLDAGRYAMFISTTWTDNDGKEQTRMGVRYSELLAFIIGAM